MVADKVKVEIVRGCQGLAVLINDNRVAGPKAWGGGVVIASYIVDGADIVAALREGHNDAGL